MVFSPSQVDSYDVTVDEELGDIQLIKIEKRKYWLHDDWYLKYITLKTPCGDYIEFPCYRWISGEGEIVLRDGRGEQLRHLLLPVSQESFQALLPRRAVFTGIITVPSVVKHLLCVSCTCKRCDRPPSTKSPRLRR